MAAGSASFTSVQNALRVKYPQPKVYDLTYKNNPLLGMVKKVDDFDGDYISITIQHGSQQGVSSTFASAVTNKSTNLYKKFALTRGFAYAIGSIDGLALRVGRSNAGALLNTLDREQKGVLQQTSRKLQRDLYGSGGGSIGQVGVLGAATGVATPFSATPPTLAANQMQVASYSQIVWFEVDQRVQFYSTDGTTSGTLRAGGPLVVTAVDRKKGVVTFSANVSTITGLTAGDYAFIDGDIAFTAATPPLTGLEGWLPINGPTSTAFFGLDRTPDPTRLAGLTVDGTNKPIEEALQQAMALAGQEGSSPDTGLMNPIDLESMVLALNSRTGYVLGKAERKSTQEANVGYSGVSIVTPFGNFEIFPDPGCPMGRAYVLDLDTWALHTLGDFPGYIDEDGLKMLREQSADQFTWRMGAFGNLACEAPGKNAVVKLY